MSAIALRPQRTRSSLKMAVSATDTFLYEAIASGLIPPLVASQVKYLAYKVCILHNVNTKKRQHNFTERK